MTAYSLSAADHLASLDIVGADGPSRVPCDAAGWVPQPTSSSLTSSDHPESTGRSGGWPRSPPGALALLSGSEVVGGGDAAGEGAAGAAVAGARAIDRDAWGVAGGITGGTGGGSGGSSGGGSGGVFFGGPRGGGSFQCAALPCSFLRSLGRANGGSDGGVKVGLKKRRCRSCVATAQGGGAR